MTYNFDPDKWYDNEIAFLENNYKTGKILETEFKESLELLSNKHKEMCDRLNGTYQLPH